MIKITSRIGICIHFTPDAERVDRLDGRMVMLTRIPSDPGDQSQRTGPWVHPRRQHFCFRDDFTTRQATGSRGLIYS